MVSEENLRFLRSRESSYWCSNVIRIGCFAHVMRKFFEAKEESPDFAPLDLSAIQKLYRIEREAKGRSAGEWRQLRCEESLSLLESIRGRSRIDRQRRFRRANSGWRSATPSINGRCLTRYVEVIEAEIDNNRPGLPVTCILCSTPSGAPLVDSPGEAMVRHS
jgi:hypothetical protein